MSVVFTLKLGLKIAEKWKYNFWGEDLSTFFETNKEKNKGERFSQILDNIA